MTRFSITRTQAHAQDGDRHEHRRRMERQQQPLSPFGASFNALRPLIS